MKSVAFGALALLLLGSLAALPAQWPTQRKPAKAPETLEEELPTIKVDVDLVNVYCSVRDKNRGLVGNLNQQDFIIKEDGKQQTISFFSRETDLPLTLGLLVDVSLSQQNLIEVEKQAAAQFFQSVLRPKDMAFLASFGADVELLQDLTASQTALRRGLDLLRVSGSPVGLHPGPVPTISQPRGTVLFDAVYLAAREVLAREVGRKAIIMITDGVDTGSRVKRAAAIEAAQKADVIIYSIYYFDPSAYMQAGYPFGVSDADLKKMSEETGGRVFYVDRKHTLPEIFKELQDELRSQYAIGYVPTNTLQDGKYREIEIRTRNKDLKVQHRKGYYSRRAN